MALHVRTIDRAEHLRHQREHPPASFLQVPAWGDVLSRWTTTSIGWFDDSELVGTALLLTRRVRGARRPIACLPGAPDLPQLTADGGRHAAEILEPLAVFAKDQGAFSLRIAPPSVARIWQPSAVARATPDSSRIDDLPPDWTNPAREDLGTELARHGWLVNETDTGSIAPRFAARVPLPGRTQDDLLASLTPAVRTTLDEVAASGVTVSRVGGDALDDFYRVYERSADRDGFVPRPSSYFSRLWTAMSSEDPGRMGLYLARRQARTVAAAITLTIGGRWWYLYGAESATASPGCLAAVQWRVITDALDDDAALVDLQRVDPTLRDGRAASRSTAYKLSLGADVVEREGEWDRVLRPLTARMVGWTRHAGRQRVA